MVKSGDYGVIKGDFDPLLLLLLFECDMTHLTSLMLELLAAAPKRTRTLSFSARGELLSRDVKTLRSFSHARSYCSLQVLYSFLLSQYDSLRMLLT
jgi:hypothetical protein